jgi:hypothetical protein
LNSRVLFIASPATEPLTFASASHSPKLFIS